MSNANFHLNRYKPWLIASFFILLLIAVESYLVYIVYSTRVAGTADFFSRWYGAKELILNGRNPYGEDVETETQLAMFGAVRAADQDQVNFAYPLYTIYLFWPLTFVSYAWAQAIWMVILQFALLGAIGLLFNLVRWKPPTLLFAVTVLWSLFFYSATRAIMLGQFSVIVFLCLTITMWGVVNSHDKLAGAILPLTTIKPQMIFLVIPFILLWSWRQRRWSFIIAFGLSSAGLLLTSLIWLPDWPLHFIKVALAYADYVNHGAPLENMTARFLPTLDHLLNPLLTILLLALLLWQWGLALSTQADSFLWVINITLLISNLIAFRSATTNHIVLYLTMFILFNRLSPAHWKIVAIQLVSLIGLWILFATTIDKSRAHNFEALFMHGFLPVLLLVYSLLDWFKLKAITPKINLVQ
jgi:hypothetical protein